MDRFWQYDPAFAMQQLNTCKDGLDDTKAKEILRSQAGKRKTISALQKDMRLFLRQFKSPLMLLLVGAVLLSAFLGDTSDVFIILFIVLSTGLLSFLQERNANRIVEQLQSLIARKTTVLRNNKTREIASKELVQGDIILLRAGDIIPADCLLIESNELHTNEASLTGESFPSRKAAGQLSPDTELSHRTNCLWEGTNVISGSGKAIVIHTGIDTIFGSIVNSTNTVVETSFEKGIRDFGFFLMKITLVLSVFILTVNLLNHKSVIESALFALALAIGMAPELLPAITTIAMSAGAKRLLNKKVIVKKLASIQNLGEVNLLCTDKTGTITEGTIGIHGILDGTGHASSFAKSLAYWNASLESGYQNPIDQALKNMPMDDSIIPKKLGEIPYDFIRKRLSILVESNESKLLISKGAVNETLAICKYMRMSDDSIESIETHRTNLEKANSAYGEKGLRTLAIAYKTLPVEAFDKTDENDLIFAGFILLQDPVKEGISEIIKELKSLQVDLKIITGDNKNVARSIAQQIGIENPVVLTGKEMLEINPEALIQKARQTHIFAEVAPQEKERIIQALRHSFTVAYMGDGINDVSAINAADIGISVDNAVDVAKEAADFVVMEKNLFVLLEGIQEGRKTFANTLKYIFINTGSTFGNMFSVAIASLLLPFLPMLPKQILLTNFITDFPYLTIASDNVDQEQLSRPGRWNIKMIRNYMIIFGIHSSLFDLMTFLSLLYILKVKEGSFQTAWFVESILTELFILFIIRTHHSFFKSKPGNYLFWLSLLGLIMTIGLPYTPFAGEVELVPLAPFQLLFMLAIVFLYITTADLLKIWFFKKHSTA